MTFPPPVRGVGRRCLRIRPKSPVVVVVGLRLVPFSPAAGVLWKGQFDGRHRPPEAGSLVLWDGGGPKRRRQRRRQRFNDGISERRRIFFFQYPHYDRRWEDHSVLKKTVTIPWHGCALDASRYLSMQPSSVIPRSSAIRCHRRRKTWPRGQWWHRRCRCRCRRRRRHCRHRHQATSPLGIP
jgi:hypothetical protein